MSNEKISDIFFCFLLYFFFHILLTSVHTLSKLWKKKHDKNFYIINSIKNTQISCMINFDYITGTGNSVRCYSCERAQLVPRKQEQGLGRGSQVAAQLLQVTARRRHHVFGVLASSLRFSCSRILHVGTQGLYKSVL